MGMSTQHLACSLVHSRCVKMVSMDLISQYLLWLFELIYTWSCVAVLINILVEVLWCSVFVDNSKNAWMFSSLIQQNQVHGCMCIILDASMPSDSDQWTLQQWDLWFKDSADSMKIAQLSQNESLPHACMREGVKQLVLSVCQSVSLSVCQPVCPVKNFEI